MGNSNKTIAIITIRGMLPESLIPERCSNTGDA